MKAFDRLNPISKWILAAVAIFVLYNYWRIIDPFILTLVTAALFAVLFSRVDYWLTKKLKSPHLSAALITLFVVLVIFAPLGVIAGIVVQQASDALNEGFVTGIPSAILSSYQELQAYLPAFANDAIASVDFTSLSSSALNWLQNNLGDILAGGANFLLQLFLFLAFLYYFLLHKDAIRKELYELSPFKDKLDQSIISRIAGTVRGVILGAIVIAMIQALMASLGFTIFGVPRGFLWGSFALIAAQIPVFGVGLVMIPGILYLFIAGNIPAAIGLTIWSVVVVGLIDNMLSPIIVGRRTQMPELFILISVLGGIKLFGPIGFVIGPVSLACVLVLRDLYKSGALH